MNRHSATLGYLATLLDLDPAEDGPAPSLAHRWLREIPLLAGVAVGCFLLWWRGAAFVPLEVPVGPDWHQYFMAAWKVMGDLAQDYPAFRLPLYPWLVGSLGTWLGYAPTALLLSSCAMVLVVLCAGGAARLLAGPWAGGVAALSVPLVATNAEAARWASQYPVFGALAGLALVASLALVRGPRWPWALVAGAAAGLTWAVDNRGVVVLVIAALLTILALSRSLRWRERGLLAGLFCVGFALGPFAQRLLQVVARPSSHWLLQFQRGQSMGDIQNLRVEGLVELCTPAFVEQAGLLDGWRYPCGQALLAHNLRDFGVELPAGLLLSAIALPLVLLPGRQGWRGSAASALVLLPVLAAMAFAATLIDLPGRYYLPFAVPLALLVPVGLARLGHTAVCGRRFPAAALLCAALGLWLLLAGPPERRPVAPLHRYQQVQLIQARLLPAIQRQLGPQDLMLDCSHNLMLEVAALPFIHHPQPSALREAPDLKRCMAWVADPPGGEGARWLVTDERWPGVSPSTGGWESVERATSPDHSGTLWRYRGTNAR